MNVSFLFENIDVSKYLIRDPHKYIQKDSIVRRVEVKMVKVGVWMRGSVPIGALDSGGLSWIGG